MAQNRLLLRCRVCGVDISIARLSVGDVVWTPARTSVDEYAAFLRAHTECSDTNTLTINLTAENDEQIDLHDGGR